MTTNGVAELARRLHRVFIANVDTGAVVDDASLLRFATDLLAGDYTDPAWGKRPGDGGEAMALVPHRWVLDGTVNVGAPGGQADATPADVPLFQGYVIPAWARYPHSAERPVECRSCHAPVLWVRTRATGKRAPLNPDGTSHFATCPQADQWRKQS